MKIAIPVWENRISPVFDSSARLLIFDTDSQPKPSRSEIYLDEPYLIQRCTRIKSLGVEMLICGAISRSAYRMLVSCGIHVVSWISGRVDEVIEACLCGEILHSEFLMPGSRWDSKKRVLTAGCQRLLRSKKS